MKIFWTEERIADTLRKKAQELGRKPTAQEMPAAFVKSAQKRFGSWNKALKYSFGSVTQARYGEITNQELLEIIRDFVKKYHRLPQRQEFDGKNYPYFESYLTRFGVTRWADILKLVDLEGLTYYANKHGYGKLIHYKGVTYLSREEYLIGKYLSDNDIAFEKEVPYGNAPYVFDFFLPEHQVYIEYYGIATKEYKEVCAKKRQSYGDRRVIEIYKHENTVKTLALKLQRL
jgi:hypothetical protein